MFNLELLQAINDWQRGGDSKQKTKRAKTLKIKAQDLPIKFKQVKNDSYRQLALDKKSVWQVGTIYKLDETISAWTEDINVAKNFKGGVPPEGWQGVIFKIKPDNGEIILNLNTLFNEPEFQKAIALNKNNIIGYHKGIGKYKNTQKEVIIETDSLPIGSIYAWSGYSSSEDKIAEMFYGRKPTKGELNQFKKRLKHCNATLGPRWLTNPEAVLNASTFLKLNAKRLAKIKNLQEKVEK